jgi:SAM-dependent methyltransferase
LVTYLADTLGQPAKAILGKPVSLIGRISIAFRRRRMRWFCRALEIGPHTRILDVGGSPDTWRDLPVRPQVTLANIPMSIGEAENDLPWIAADGCALPFRDRSFDLVFSNSVIEHVGAGERQLAFARETMRVGRRYYLQTPNRRFPVEQHLFMPFLHWLPRHWQRAIIHRFTVWEWLAKPRPDQRVFYLRHYLEEVRLLDAADLTRMFPGARLTRERWLWLTKSLIVTGAAPQSNTPPPINP